MSIATVTNRLATTLLAAALSSAAVRGQVQDVYLSEIRADGTECWIEVHNRGTTTADIGTWALHCATTTPGYGNNYWWGFPTGTTLAPNAFLRVHWYQVAPTTPEAGNLYTGTSPYAFLFGLGGEMLDGTAGAAALISSQLNAHTATSSFVEDWVSWGTSGFQREYLAVNAGVWETGRYTPHIPTDGSIARDPDSIGATVHPDESWFVDYTPTPLMPNITGATVQPYGTACMVPGNHLLGHPELTATSLPLLGNSQFGFMIGNTTGIFGEYVLLAFSAGPAPSGLPSVLPEYPGSSCHEAIDTQQILLTWLVPASLFGTNVPLPLSNYSSQVIGAEMHVQALVIELIGGVNPPYQGLTNALRVVVGQ